MSRKELAALNNNEATDAKNSHSRVPLVSDLERGVTPNGGLYPSVSGMTPGVYDNPTFTNQTETEHDDNNLARTHL